MPIPLLCDCGHHFDAPAATAGPFAVCPSCGRDVLIPKPGPIEDVLFVGDDPSPSVPRFRGWAVLLGVVGVCLLLAAILMPAVRSAGGAARRSQCTGNLKMIGLALHNYHEAYGSLPPAAVVGKDGRPLLSWRVLILPYLQQENLYAKFCLDEPWDSPHNRPLAAEMPPVFACPSDPAFKPGSGLTGYQVVVGPETAFRTDFRPVRFDEITDGTAITLLVGESARPVLWTKPDDLRSNDPASLVGLGSLHPGGFNAAFANGSIRFLKRTIKPGTLQALLTRAGGEVVNTDQF